MIGDDNSVFGYLLIKFRRAKYNNHDFGNS